MKDMIPLNLAMTGQTGRIADIDGQPEAVGRLNEIGVCVGTSMRVVRSGSPCIVAIGDQRLSFRGEQAASIYLTVQ